MFHSLKEFFLIPVEFFQHATRLTYAALGIAVVVGILYFKIMFREPDDFGGQPVDLTQRVERKWTQWKVITWMLICFLSYLAAYHQLPNWFPTVFP